MKKKGVALLPLMLLALASCGNNNKEKETTVAPTATIAPTATAKPTIAPTATAKPTVAPTATAKPTTKPTVAPTATAKPTIAPTATPTTVKPTVVPTSTTVVNFVPYNHEHGVGYFKADYKPVLYYEFEVVHDGSFFYIDAFAYNNDYESPDYVKNVTIYADKEMKNTLYTMDDFVNYDYYGSSVKSLNEPEGLKIGKYYLVAEVNDLELGDPVNDEIRFDVYYESDHYFDMWGKCSDCDAIEEGIVNVQGLTYTNTVTLNPGDSLKVIFDSSSLTSDKMYVSIIATKDNENNITIDGFDCNSNQCLRTNIDNVGDLPLMEYNKGKFVVIFASASWANSTPTTITVGITIR